MKLSWDLAGFGGYLATAMFADTVDPADGLTDDPTEGTGEASQQCGATTGRPSLNKKPTWFCLNMQSLSAQIESG